jgi:hypothetical protein
VVGKNYRYMEILNSFAGQTNALITSHSALETANLVIADTIYLTILQKRKNRRNGPSHDNMKMQVT